MDEKRVLDGRSALAVYCELLLDLSMRIYDAAARDEYAVLCLKDPKQDELQQRIIQANQEAAKNGIKTFPVPRVWTRADKRRIANEPETRKTRAQRIVRLSRAYHRFVDSHALACYEAFPAAVESRIAPILEKSDAEFRELLRIVREASAAPQRFLAIADAVFQVIRTMGELSELARPGSGAALRPTRHSSIFLADQPEAKAESETVGEDDRKWSIPLTMDQQRAIFGGVSETTVKRRRKGIATQCKGKNQFQYNLPRLQSTHPDAFKRYKELDNPDT
ncbi:MAG: hypothetical protein WDZ51_16460 [Pirellulaceae bacterium]